MKDAVNKSSGKACIHTRNWNDEAVGSAFYAEHIYAYSLSSVTTSMFRGWIQPYIVWRKASAIDKQINIPLGLGTERVRLCFVDSRNAMGCKHNPIQVWLSSLIIELPPCSSVNKPTSTLHRPFHSSHPKARASQTPHDPYCLPPP